MKESIYGKQIWNFVNNKLFVNLQLPDYDTGNYTPVLSENKKYSFVIFSASWCAPCHKLIPFLKKAYRDLGTSMEMVYISTDDDRTVKAWKDLMHKESIPWKSLLASDNIDFVKKTCMVKYIPLIYLVHPDRH